MLDFLYKIGLALATDPAPIDPPPPPNPFFVALYD